MGGLFAANPGAFPLPAIPSLHFRDLLAPRADLPVDHEIRARFEQGVVMLHMRQYDYALTAFHHVLSRAPEMPEAHVNMGFALLGLEQWAQARDFFESATVLRREQYNAYYGMAIALEALGDLPGALGAMQTYLHRAPPDDPYRERAGAAIWEWREASRGAVGNDGEAGDAPRPPTSKD